MIDKAATIKEAQKFLAKGQLDKAIAEWEKLAAAYPEGNTFNFVGDLYLKKGNQQKAAENYHKATSVFKTEGFALKALALYKKILNINPHDADALYALGQLNEEKSIITDAVKYYLAAAEIYSRDNLKNKLLEVYERIVGLAPSNIHLRVKLAEMFSKHGFAAEASNEYRQIGLLYERQGNMELCGRYFMKSIELQPGNRETLIATSRMFEKQGDLEQALRHVNLAIERTGEDRELLLLASNLHSMRGDFEEALKLVGKVTEAQPSDIDARKTLADLYRMSGNDEKAWQEYITVIEALTADGRADEAVAALESFKSLEPVESRKMLISIHRRLDREEPAVGEMLELAQYYENNDMKEAALSALKEALLIQPGNESLASSIEELERELLGGEAAEGLVIAQKPEAQTAGVQTEQKAAPETEAGKTLDETLLEADIFIRYGLYPDAKKLLNELKLKEPANIEVHRKLKTLFTATGEQEAVVTECIILAELYGREGDTQNRTALLREAYELNPEDPRLAGKLPDTVRPAKEETRPEAAGFMDVLETPAGRGTAIDDYGEELAQVEFYIKEGQNHEAGEILDRLIALFPENEELKSKQRMLHTARSAAPKLEVVKPEAAGPGEPEIESEVLEIFEEFKKGLEKELSAEDTETHYNLGIAYREMGLVDDAIRSLQTSRRDPKYFVGATSMLGLCYMQKGLYPLAIDSFQSALLKSRPEDSWGLKYELAEAYEKSGNQSEALRLFTEVYGWDSKFREVEQKIESLKNSLAAKQKAKNRRSRVSYI